MKKIQMLEKGLYYILYIALAVVLLGACKKEVSSFEPKIILGTQGSVSVTNKSTEQRIPMLSNVPWTVKSNANWITFTKTEGEKGKDAIVFTVAPNNDEERTATITITNADGTITKEITVIQESGLKNNFYVKAGATGQGRSWDNPCNLDDALTNSVGGSVIHIAAGTYVPTKTITAGDAADAGDITFEISKNVTIIGGYPANASGNAQPDPSTNKTILTGKLPTSEAYHVVTVTAPKVEGEKVIMEGLTITGGNGSAAATIVTINGKDFRRNYGAGVTIGYSNVEMNKCEIIENKSNQFVAGVYVFGGSQLIIKNSKVNKNISKGNGSGMWVNAAEVYAYNCEFNENESPGTAPGVHGYPDATVYLYNSVVANNKGNSYGAAFYIRQKPKGIIVNTLIYGNVSGSKNGGGGVMMYDNCEAVIVSSTITANTIAGPGGGVYRRLNTNKLSIYNSIISGNTQMAGSTDVAAYEANAVEPEIRSSVISTKAYSSSGSEVDGASFNPSTMFNERYFPIGNGNPALILGMGGTALKALAATFTPPLDNAVSGDKNENSREGLTIMGALVK